MFCQIKGCSNKTKITYCNKAVCKHCIQKAKLDKKIENAEYREELKRLGAIAAQDWFNRHWKDLKKLPFKNKKKCLDKILFFYENFTLNEPMFNILIVDLINLQGGDAVQQYPYPKDFRLSGKRADVFDRKNNLAIECKAAWFASTAQKELPLQLKEYRHNFGPKAVVLAVSPDNVQPLTTDLLTVCQIIIKICKK